MKGLGSVLVLLVSVSVAKSTNFENCVDLQPFHNFDVDQILGLWYIHEYVFHNEYQVKMEVNPYCPTIHLRRWEDVAGDGFPSTNPPYFDGVADTYYAHQRPFEGQHDARYRNLVLQWKEGIFPDEYHIRLNMSRRGFWMSTAPAYRLSAMYNHYAVTIQVLKAVNNHLVLNFCSRLPEYKLFTVILSRSENQLTDGDIMTIHNLLSRKSLSIASQKRVCQSSAIKAAISSLVLFISALVLSLP